MHNDTILPKEAPEPKFTEQSSIDFKITFTKYDSDYNDLYNVTFVNLSPVQVTALESIYKSWKSK